jgi:hypothetical protein
VSGYLWLSLAGHLSFSFTLITIGIGTSMLFLYIGKPRS